MTRSARGSISSTASGVEYTVEHRPLKITSRSRSRSIERTKTKTSASIPIAMKAAFMPTTPPPITITLAAADQHPPPPLRLLQHVGARLGGDLPRHLAHRRQQRQPAGRVLDRLVGDRCHPGGGEAAG